MKESTADVPILGYKGARLSWVENKGPTFRPLHHENVYGAEAEATCSVDSFLTSMLSGSRSMEPHGPIPGARCSCGFYACREPADITYGCLLLTVELSGRVIVHETGYRAEHQTVVGAKLVGCQYCGSEDIHSAEFVDDGMIIVCADHTTASNKRLSLERLSECLGVPIT